ncbi:MAG: NTP transferase domain-containing protein [Caulobacteraceae bacterium]
MKALIVAAGQGTRLRDIAASKPLALVRGVALIERVIEAAHIAGVREFVVVTGYEGRRLEAFLAALAARRGYAITCVRNLAWRQANGVSVIAAEQHLGERFVLMMADHLFDPTILGDLIAAPVPEGGAVLAIDRRLDNPLVDLEDVTRVETGKDGAIRTIGKLIEPYDAFDTGFFLASGALIRALREDIAAGGAGGISAGMIILARSGLATTFDIGARFWLDVDDAVAHGHAERMRA